MTELRPVSEYLTLRWIKALEIRNMARYVSKYEARNRSYPEAAVVFDLMPDVSEVFVFTSVNERICMFIPAVVFYSLKHVLKELIFEDGYVFFVFNIGNGVGVFRIHAHPDITKSLKLNAEHDGIILVGGYIKAGNDFVVEGRESLDPESLSEILYGGDGHQYDGDSENAPLDVIDDHFSVSLIGKD